MLSSGKSCEVLQIVDEFQILCDFAGMSTTTRAVVPPRRQLSVKERSTVAEVNSEDSDDTESRHGWNYGRYSF